MDGRKATGGKLEVMVKIREPLSGADLQPVTEKWLVVDPVSTLSPTERQKEKKERVSRVFSSSRGHRKRMQTPHKYSSWPGQVVTCVCNLCMKH